MDELKMNKDDLNTLSIEKQIILVLLKRTLMDSIVPLPCSITTENWPILYEEMKLHSIAALTYAGLETFEKRELDDGILLQWKKTAFSTISRSQYVLSVQKEITQLLDARQINYVIMKGFATALCYNDNYLLRAEGDIDISIKKDDFDTVHSILIQHNCSDKGGWDEHREYSYKGIEIEIQMGRYYRIDEDTKTVCVTIDGYEFQVPDIDSQILIAIEHTKTHFLAGNRLATLVRLFNVIKGKVE